MDFSNMTDEQVFYALRVAERAKREAEATFMACSLELEDRANAEYERQQAVERAVAMRDARDAAVDYDIQRYELETEFLRTNFTEE